MPQNRPPAGYGRTAAAPDKPQPHTAEYALPDDGTDETTGTPPALMPGLVVGGTQWPVEPAMRDAFNAARGALDAAHISGRRETASWCNPTREETHPWEVAPPTPEALEAANARGGQTSLHNRPTTPPEPPEEVEEPARWIAPTQVLGMNGEPLPEAPAPPPLRPIDRLVQAVEQTFGIQTEKELDPEPARPDGKELGDWWHRVADSDLEMLLPKAVEYSAHDLRMTGHVMADLMGIKVDDAFAAELACAVYLMSKVTRILGAYKDGRLPSSDSLTDSRVYATMMARIREKGSWPGWDVGRDTTSQ